MSDRKSLPILVGGCHRSGTTLLRHILDSHSGIYCGPEIKFFRDFYEDYFEDPLRHLRYAETARAALPEEELLGILGRSFIAVHERAARAAGKRRWADKNPENVVYLKAWQKLLGDAWLFVHVVRNPFDTMASILEHPFPLTIPPTLAGRIEFYKRYMESGLSFQRDAPDRYYRVAYEDLVASPREAVGPVMTWLGEELEPAQLKLDHEKHAKGLGDPKIAARPEISASSVGRWHGALPEEDVKLIWRETRDLWLKVDPKNRHGLR